MPFNLHIFLLFLFSHQSSLTPLVIERVLRIYPCVPFHCYFSVAEDFPDFLSTFGGLPWDRYLGNWYTPPQRVVPNTSLPPPSLYGNSAGPPPAFPAASSTASAPPPATSSGSIWEQPNSPPARQAMYQALPREPTPPGIERVSAVLIRDATLPGFPQIPFFSIQFFLWGGG